MFIQKKMLVLVGLSSLAFSAFAEGTCYRCEQIRENNRKNAPKENTYYDDHIEKVDKEKTSKKDDATRQ